jgi:hypothetical protein
MVLYSFFDLLFPLYTFYKNGTITLPREARKWSGISGEGLTNARRYANV